MPYCRECGSQAAHTASYCSSCGTSIVLPRDFEPRSHRNRFVAATLAVVFGFFGVHHIYLGSYKRAALYMIFSVTAVPFFLGLYDAYRYVRADEAEFHRRFVVRETGDGDDTERTADETRRETGDVEATANTDSSRTKNASTEERGDVNGNDEPFLTRAVGIDGEVILYGDRIQIVREGREQPFLSFYRGGKVISLDEVTSVELRKPGRWSRGFVEIGERGYTEKASHHASENAVEFRSGQLDAFERVRDAIQTLRGDEGQAMSALEKLYATGTITEEEYRERKRVLEGR